MTELIIREAKGDNDVVTIHGFLCITMGPVLPGPIDPTDSATEVWRVVNQEAALMVLRGDKLIGTLGIIQPKFWWGKGHFFTNRWFSVLPGFGAGKLLLREATAIAKASGMEFLLADEGRGRITILNKSPERKPVNPYLARPIAEPAHETPPSLH